LQPAALHNLKSGSLQARANDTTAQYAVIQLDMQCSMQTYHRPNRPHKAFNP